ncbi:uncharacterized protein THITE_118016 [Thermothielavioides terrestris NRRL 8126]|uniref:Uncharacterized protein n=1 Tax=Thermothielavioides terrestris (strain ATCC 38088 / NRRL 8126) TaxID=578455 RepID=G2R6C7_THETT|nr:uncharacterized protein THITE_118016 [Thermothielavioides terrestris NRRL 8126]AEO67612.1 hypothetical protein THITE_118016 [Thermothielavioides terrestris NRRL 8126]
MQKQRWASQAGGDRALPIHILVVDADYEHSLPPPSAGLTPFPEDHDYGSDKGTTSAFHGMWLHPDNQTLGTGAFTIADYGGGDDAEAENAEEDSSLDVPSEEPELGSYYDVPADDEEQSLPSGQLKPPLEGWAYRGDLHSVSGTPPDTGKLLRVSRDDLQSEGAIFDHYNDEVEGTSEPESQYDNDPLDAYHGEHASGKGYKPVSREAPSGPTSPKRGHGPLTDRSASIDGLEAEPDGAVVLDAKSDPPRADESGSEVDFPLDNGVLTPDPQEFPFSELPSPSLYIGLHNEPLSKALIQNPFPTEANRNQNTKSLEHERANHAQGVNDNSIHAHNDDKHSTSHAHFTTMRNSSAPLDTSARRVESASGSLHDTSCGDSDGSQVGNEDLKEEEGIDGKAVGQFDEAEVDKDSKPAMESHMLLGGERASTSKPLPKSEAESCLRGAKRLLSVHDGLPLEGEPDVLFGGDRAILPEACARPHGGEHRLSPENGDEILLEGELELLFGYQEPDSNSADSAPLEGGFDHQRTLTEPESPEAELVGAEDSAESVARGSKRGLDQGVQIDDVGHKGHPDEGVLGKPLSTETSTEEAQSDGTPALGQSQTFDELTPMDRSTHLDQQNSGQPGQGSGGLSPVAGPFTPRSTALGVTSAFDVYSESEPETEVVVHMEDARDEMSDATPGHQEAARVDSGILDPSAGHVQPDDAESSRKLSVGDSLQGPSSDSGLSESGGESFKQQDDQVSRPEGGQNFDESRFNLGSQNRSPGPAFTESNGKHAPSPRHHRNTTSLEPVAPVSPMPQPTPPLDVKDDGPLVTPAPQHDSGENRVLTPPPDQEPRSMPSPAPFGEALHEINVYLDSTVDSGNSSLATLPEDNSGLQKRHNRVDNNGEVTSAEQRDEKPTAEDDLKADVAEPWHEEEPGPKSTPPLEEHERPPDDDFDFHHPSARMQDDQGVIPKAAQSRVVASEEPLDRNETRGAEMHMRVPQLEAGVVYPDVQQQHLHDGQVPRFPRLEARDGLPARPAPSFRQRPKGQYHPDAYSVPARPERDIHRTLDIHRSPEQRYPTARTRNGAVPYHVYAPMRMMAVRGEPLEVAVGEFSNSRGPEPSPKRQGLLARLFGWKPRRRRTEVEETGRNPYSEAHSTPPKRRGLLGLLFNPHRLSKTEDRDTDNGTYRSHQLETAPNRRDITARTLQKKHRPQPSRDGYANPDLRAPHETPTKPQGFLASVFSSFRPKRNTRPQPSNSFLSRLLAPFRRTTRQPSDIELGALDSHHHRYHHHNNKNNNPLGLGRVHISSPQFIYHRPGLPQYAPAVAAPAVTTTTTAPGWTAGRDNNNSVWPTLPEQQRGGRPQAQAPGQGQRKAGGSDLRRDRESRSRVGMGMGIGTGLGMGWYRQGSFGDAAAGSGAGGAVCHYGATIQVALWSTGKLGNWGTLLWNPKFEWMISLYFRKRKRRRNAGRECRSLGRLHYGAILAPPAFRLEEWKWKEKRPDDNQSRTALEYAVRHDCA